MARYPRCRILAIIGSGETSPTMVTVHKDLLSRLGVRDPQALLLATPYAFQENAASVSARAQRYFADSVGLQVRVALGTSRNADPQMAPPMIGWGAASLEGPGGHADPAPGGHAGPAPEGDAGPGPEALEGLERREAADIRTADWVFAGPGSPSYGLAHWQARQARGARGPRGPGLVAAALRERVLAGNGLTVLASAAAATAGRFTLPVYEIYKAGGAPRWLAGLDLFGLLGLKVAVIPHYDNAEGGHYDTRYCYLGARRLAVIERELPADAAVLGVDEHTAMLIDLRSGDIEIRGRGTVTVRRAGDSTILPAGTPMSLPELRSLILGAKPTGRQATARPTTARAGGSDSQEGGDTADENAGRKVPAGEPGDALPLPLPEVMAGAERGFGTASGERDAAAMVEVILELESAIRQWEADTDEDQGTEQARALLRSLIGRLGRAAHDGLTDPRDRLRPAVERLIELRDTLRGAGNFAAADAIRQALAAAGLELSDTPDGTRWRPAETV
jgi:hypothetical protein